MRIASSVTAISWIPSDAIEGMPKFPFELGVARYDSPPPDHIEKGDLERLRAEDRFREANELAAWIDVEGEKIVDHGYEGTGLVGSTTFNLGIGTSRSPASRSRCSGPTRRHTETPSDSCRRSVVAPGSRPRAGSWQALRENPVGDRMDDARPHDPRRRVVGDELVGASTFPRHWVYDSEGNLDAKTGTIDFRAWYQGAHGEHTPWGDEESDAFVTAAESALERELSRELMAGQQIPERLARELHRVVDQIEDEPFQPARVTERHNRRSRLAAQRDRARVATGSSVSTSELASSPRSTAPNDNGI